MNETWREMKIIALNGYARSGKDTAASVLVEEYGFTRVAFADKLRDFLYALNPLVGMEGEPYEGGLVEVGVQNVIDAHGWDGYKDTDFGPIIRAYLQRLGTEAGRETLWDSIWIDAALNGTDAKKIVISDCRFPNEAEAIKERGGLVWRINRKGTGPANAHKSETGLDNWSFDEVLLNDHTLDDFRNDVRGAFRRSPLGEDE